MTNKAGELQQMWYDFNATAKNETHAVLEWQEGLKYPGLLKNTAISAINDFTSRPHTKHVIVQDEELNILELVSNGTAENDMWDRSLVVGEEKGYDNTRIGSVILNTGM